MANLVVSFVTEAVTIVLGLLLPRIILVAWGSEYNGLLSSVTNILQYLTLLEAGFNTATVQALYKTIGQNDQEQTSVIIRTSQHYYHRVSIIYAGIVFLISLLYPLAVSSEIPYWEIVLIIILQGMVGVMNFAFRASYQQLLNAEGKYYIISIITLITTILTYTSKIVAALVFNNVLIMQIMGVIIIMIQVVIYAVYFNNRYKWINKKARINGALLENRKYYLIQQVAGLIFSSTDTIVLSIFCGLKVASVYAVYNLVYAGLAQIMGLFRKSTGFMLGQAYHQEESLFKKTYDAYSAVQATIGGVMASISILLILSFVRIYTAGINDINYLDYIVALIFSFNLILECSRGASLAAANIAGKAPETTSHYIAEAAINLSTSLVLVQFLGIRGVLLGTSLAGLYRTTDSIIYTNRHVLHQSPKSEIKTVLVSFGLFFVFSYLGYVAHVYSVQNYGQLLAAALMEGIIVCAVYAAVFILLNRSEAKMLMTFIRKSH